MRSDSVGKRQLAWLAFRKIALLAAQYSLVFREGHVPLTTQAIFWRPSATSRSTFGLKCSKEALGAGLEVKNGILYQLDCSIRGNNFTTSA